MVLDFYHTYIAIFFVFTTYIPPIISRAPDFVCTDDYCCSYTPDYSTILLWKETRCGLHILNFLEKKRENLERSFSVFLCMYIVHACSTSLSAEIPFLGERTCFCFESTYVNYSVEFWKDSCRIFPKDFCMYNRQFFKEINSK